MLSKKSARRSSLGRIDTKSKGERARDESSFEGRIESRVVMRGDGRERLRATVGNAPDAPVSRAIVDMQGGQKGLFVNSRHLCFKAKRNRARANLSGHNGASSLTRPVARAVACSKKRGGKAKRAGVSAARVAGDGGR